LRDGLVLVTIAVDFVERAVNQASAPNLDRAGDLELLPRRPNGLTIPLRGIARVCALNEERAAVEIEKRMDVENVGRVDGPHPHTPHAHWLHGRARS